MKNEKQNERKANGQQLKGIQNIPVVKVKINCSANTTPEMFLAHVMPTNRWQGTNGSNSTLQSHIIGKAPPC